MTRVRPLSPAGRGPEGSLVAVLSERLDPLTAAAARALIDAVERRASALQQLQQVAAVLSRTVDEEVILAEVARAMARGMGEASVLVLDAEGDAPDLRARCHLGPVGDLPLIALPAGTPALAEALLSGAPQRLSRDNPAHTAAIDHLQSFVGEIDAVLVAPMMQGRKLLGVLAAYSATRHAFEAELSEFAMTLAATAGAALRTARLYAESERERRQSDAMAEVARAAGESLRVTEVQRLILRHAMALLRASGACIAVRDGDYLNIETATGACDVLAGLVLPVRGSLAGKVVESGEAVISNAVTTEPDVHARTLQLVSLRETVIVPLRTVRGTVGTLGVMNRDGGFDASDARILQRLADQVAVAIVNARLFADIQESTREWQSTFDAIGVGMAVVNDEGRVLRCNVRARQLVGDETTFGLLGRPFYQAVLGRSAPTGDDPLHSAISVGTRLRARCAHEDGRRVFDIVAVPHLDSGAVVTFDLVEADTGG